MLVAPNGGHGKPIEVKEAVSDKLYPYPYSYDGKLEKIEKIAELQSEMMATLIQVLVDHHQLNEHDIKELLGYDYEVVKV